MYTYIYKNTYIYIYIYIYVYKNTYISIHILKYIHIHIYTYIYKNTHTYIYVHTYIKIHTYTYIYTYLDSSHDVDPEQRFMDFCTHQNKCRHQKNKNCTQQNECKYHSAGNSKMHEWHIGANERQHEGTCAQWVPTWVQICQMRYVKWDMSNEICQMNANMSAHVHKWALE